MATSVNGIAIIEANRFSKFVRTKDELMDWFIHFGKHGIRSVIVCTDRGYALYRDGLEQPPWQDLDDDDA